MALLTLGINSAMVLDCGYRESLVLPVSFYQLSHVMVFFLLILTKVIGLIKIIFVIKLFWITVYNISYHVVKFIDL